ncbi:MAG: MFS transporter [Omnitrophica WOR_2 bacterium RIFCSPHIGHO2_02_FULL_45_21]|nr:MAG: MFS transporter [Omnitrophica WOR_2 bacterium RIFCSPHIGHO2_02_FULL_45_21]
MKKIFDFLALKRNMVAILSIVILVELGEKMGERFLPIFILALGGNAIMVGLLNAMDNFLGAVYSFPGGYLSDRIGYKKSLMIFNLVAMLGYLIVILFPHWQTALLGAALFISWSSISLPAIMSAVSKILPDKKRTMGVTMHSLVRRLPMAIGPVLGGLCIKLWGEVDGVRAAFSVSFVLAFIAIFIQHFFLEEVKSQAPTIINPLAVIKKVSPALKKLLISDILIRFCEQIPYAFVVVWVMKNLNRGAVEFGLLTTVEMVTAILIYIPVAYLVEKNKSKKPYIAITFGFFSLFPLALMFSRSITTLILVFFIRGLKEFGEPTRKALILDLSPQENKGQVYGAYYLVRDLIVSVAAFAGGLLWMVSPYLNFITAFVFGIIGTAYFIAYCEE